MMGTSLGTIQGLVERPRESLAIELKRWINPDQPEGKSKIVRAALALRNHNGGYLIIGFDDNTLEPDKDNVPDDVEDLFHLDKIQGLISKYSSEPFEIIIRFPEREGQKHPVIEIPSGVRTPVAAKLDLCQSGGNSIIRTGDLYVRTLHSNNTPSTAKASWKDWSKIIEICFDNREADIGRFLRRHLGEVSPDIVKQLASVITSNSGPQPTEEECLCQLLKDGKNRFDQLLNERHIKLPEHGSWETALMLIGAVPEHSADLAFLKLLNSSNPALVGWPVWLDSRGFPDSSSRPFVNKKGWEALISNNGHAASSIDFMRLDPKGQFYLYRTLEDDIYPDECPPLQELDYGLPILRTAEAIAVGIAFSKAMGCSPDTMLSFAFRWTKLKNRRISSWASQARYFSPGKDAYQDEVTTFVNIPIDTPSSAVSEYVYKATQELFNLFDGLVLRKDIVEDLSRRLIERKL
jgi:hypothetical protein